MSFVLALEENQKYSLYFSNVAFRKSYNYFYHSLLDLKQSGPPGGREECKQEPSGSGRLCEFKISSKITVWAEWRVLQEERDGSLKYKYNMHAHNIELTSMERRYSTIWAIVNRIHITRQNSQRNMFTGHVIFFRQKAALNFPSQFPLKVKYSARIRGRSTSKANWSLLSRA